MTLPPALRALLTKNNAILLIAIVLIAGAITYIERAKPKHVIPEGEAVEVTHDPVAETPDYATKAKKYDHAKELVSPDGYLNTNGEPITLSQYIGKKVILLDFWTYSCINCQRTLPYLTAWDAKYRDAGLVIIGVHTPEFEFEKDKANVQMALTKYGIKYPVVQDNEYATWDAYGNRYWPEHYLIDINGLVVDQHIGEGGYDETETLIQKLLTERKNVLKDPTPIPTGVVVPGEETHTGSPETYFGALRNQYLGNGTQTKLGSQTLTLPSTVVPNTLYLSGMWNFSGEYATNESPDDRIVYSYDATHVYLVAGAAEGVDITVLRDGVPVSGEKGADVDENGVVHIKEPRLYKLIDEKERGTHTIEIRVSRPGLQAFTFTFG